MKVLGCSLLMDTPPFFSLSEYSGPATRLPSPSREATACEVWGSSPTPERRMDKVERSSCGSARGDQPKGGFARVEAPGSVLCSQETPSRPLAGRWETLVTRHASSVGSAVAWGLRMGSRVKAKVGSGGREKEDFKLSFAGLSPRGESQIFTGRKDGGQVRNDQQGSH